MDFDFEIILAVAFVVTFAAWIYDRLVFAPQRKEALSQLPEAAVEAMNKEAKERLANTPKWLLEVKSYFVIIAVIFGVRSFLVEPFQIPSGSMLPTLEIGDFILVNKLDYGVRLPVLNTEIIPTTKPERGDVVVFKYPKQPNVNYIKRLIGLPGDVISYHNKTLMINGKIVEHEFLADLVISKNPSGEPVKVYNENLLGVEHEVYKSYRRSPLDGDWIVPEGQYFVMGDNRDNSADSRAWGFVPEENFKGRAFYVWLHWDEFFSLPNFKNNGLIE